MGRDSVENYSLSRRQCVFSHDELVCGMATRACELDVGMAIACLEDVSRMARIEAELRERLRQEGLHKAERTVFEVLGDDQRQCAFCKTVSTLSMTMHLLVADVVPLRGRVLVSRLASRVSAPRDPCLHNVSAIEMHLEVSVTSFSSRNLLSPRFEISLHDGRDATVDELLARACQDLPCMARPRGDTRCRGRSAEARCVDLHHCWINPCMIVRCGRIAWTVGERACATLAALCGIGATRRGLAIGG